MSWLTLPTRITFSVKQPRVGRRTAAACADDPGEFLKASPSKVLQPSRAAATVAPLVCARDSAVGRLGCRPGVCLCSSLLLWNVISPPTSGLACKPATVLSCACKPWDTEERPFWFVFFCFFKWLPSYRVAYVTSLLAPTGSLKLAKTSPNKSD